MSDLASLAYYNFILVNNIIVVVDCHFLARFWTTKPLLYNAIMSLQGSCHFLDCISHRVVGIDIKVWKLDWGSLRLSVDWKVDYMSSYNRYEAKHRELVKEYGYHGGGGGEGLSILLNLVASLNVALFTLLVCGLLIWIDILCRPTSFGNQNSSFCLRCWLLYVPLHQGKHHLFFKWI